MKVPKLKVDDDALATLITDIAKGEIRVPRFQREFVWERSRILKLLDSMYNEFPIGTIFLWNAPSEYNYLLRDLKELGLPELQSHRGYRFILDGQQRLTSLFVVINGLQFEGEDYRKIVVDLGDHVSDGNLFVFRNPDNRRWVSVSDLLKFDPFSTFNNLPSDARKKRFEQVRSALNSYPFSVVTVSEMEINDAIEIFERINQQGRRLSRYDLISASVMTPDFDLRERSKSDIIEKLNVGFGEIEETSIPQALALNIRGNTEHRTQLDIKADEIKEVWDRTVDCFVASVDFVKENLGVARREFLPYDAVLPVLVNYFFKAGLSSVLSDEHRRQLQYWFWRTAFSERYGSASQTRMNEDARWMSELIRDNAAYRDLAIVDENRLIEARMTWSRSAIRNGFLCLLNKVGPLNFINRSPVNLGTEHFSTFTSAEKHHIFPVSFLKQKSMDVRRVHSLPNFCFIPADLNKHISDRAPSDYIAEIRHGYDSRDDFEQVMSTHLIPIGEDSGIWTDDYELFLRQRASLMMDEIRRQCGIGSHINSQERDSVVNRLETALRDKIHETLQEESADYWSLIPSHTRDNLARKLEQEARKAPGNSPRRFDSTRAKLDYCDVTDYADIILSKSNWGLFLADFGSKGECNRNFGDLREYRNALKHNRDMSNIVSLRGEAAIEWFSHVLDLDLSAYGINSAAGSSQSDAGDPSHEKRSESVGHSA